MKKRGNAWETGRKTEISVTTDGGMKQVNEGRSADLPFDPLASLSSAPIFADEQTLSKEAICTLHTTTKQHKHSSKCYQTSQECTEKLKVVENILIHFLLSLLTVLHGNTVKSGCHVYDLQMSWVYNLKKSLKFVKITAKQ